MRLMMALLASVALATSASAQSISPQLQARGPLPELPIAPSLAAPAPIATAEVDRAALAVEAADAKPIEALSAPRADRAATRSEPAPIDEKLQARRPARAETKKPVEATAYRSVERVRPVARDFGRFAPPVF